MEWNRYHDAELFYSSLNGTQFAFEPERYYRDRDMSDHIALSDPGCLSITVEGDEHSRYFRTTADQAVWLIENMSR